MYKSTLGSRAFFDLSNKEDADDDMASGGAGVCSGAALRVLQLVHNSRLARDVAVLRVL